MIPKLILFEGPPGAGKSTLSEYVAKQLQLNGTPACWIEEHELEDAYLKAFSDALDGEDVDLVEALLACWTRLAHEIAERDDVFLVDGGYFGNSTKFLLGHGNSLPQIDAFVSALHELLAPFEPWIIYLDTDAEQSVRRAIHERGDHWAELIAADVAAYPYQQQRARRGVDGMLTFFADSYELLERILASCPYRQVRIDTGARNWPSYEAALLDALDVRELRPPALPSIEPERYVGVYQPPSSFPPPYHNAFSVEAHGEELVLHMYFLRNLRLVPETPSRFRIKSKPWRVEFVLDEDGYATAVVYPFVTSHRHLCVRTADGGDVAAAD